MLFVESPRPLFRGLLVWQGSYLRAAERILILAEQKSDRQMGYMPTKPGLG